MSQQQAEQSISLAAPQAALPHAPQHWNLRFQDAALENRFLTQMLLQERRGSRNIILVTLLAVLVLSVTDFRFMPSRVAWISLLVRIPLFVCCALCWARVCYSKKVTPWTQAMLAGVLLAANLTLNSPLWVGWLHQVYVPYQITLLVLLFSSFLGCLTWRYYTIVTLGTALSLAALEVCYQPDADIRNLHLTYILCATFFSLSVCYIREMKSRQQFLINVNFYEQSRHDPLTGLPNRRELDFFLPRILRQATREKVCITVAMIDVDHFKDYNDHYGHAAGDTVLVRVSEAISRQAEHPPDFVARYGGEEFVTIWFNPSLDGATLGEGLRRAVQAANIPHERSGHGMVSISVGVTSQYPTARTTAPALLSSADRALYRAKNSGRNCVRSDTIATLVAPQQQTGKNPAPRSWQDDERQNEPFFSPLPVTREDARRWNRIRGLYEYRRLALLVLMCMVSNTLLAFAHFSCLPPSLALILVLAQVIVLQPAKLIAYVLCEQTWAQKNTRFCAPPILLICAFALCYCFYSAFTQDIHFPYERAPFEFLMLLAFETYVLGGHSWKSAVATSATVSVLCIDIWAMYTDIDIIQVIEPFLVLNVLGALVSFKQDRSDIDAFLKGEKLEVLALQDALTGLANRQGLENYFRTLLPLLDQSERIVAVAMIDIDHFKDYNDHYGHTAGDAVLTAIGQELSEQRLRPYDFAARYGGEEFLLIWYHIREKDARTLGERVCQSIRDQNIPHEKSRHGRVTVSIGIAHGSISSDNSMQNLDRMIRRADTALYRAKATGRNRLVLQSEHLLPQGAQEPPADVVWPADAPNKNLPEAQAH